MSAEHLHGLWYAFVAGALMAPAVSVAQEPSLTSIVTRAYVVDATGRSLGVVVGPNRVLVNFPDADAIIGVDSAGYISTITGYASFPSAYAYRSKNCSGTAVAFPFQTPTLGSFEATAEAEPGKTPAGAFSYAIRETFVMSIGSTLERGQNLCVPRDWRESIVSSIATRDVPPFSLPLSIVVRPIAGASTAPTTSGAGVYDARGRYVGNLLDQNRIWMHLSNGDALVKTDPTGALMETEADLYFTTTDCSGAAWMDATNLPTKGGFVPIQSDPAIVSKGLIRYPRQPYETITAKSTRKTGSSDCAPRAPGAIFAGRAGGARLVGFTPPMTIR